MKNWLQLRQSWRPEMPDLQHLSYSAIQLYLTCPENWRRKYLLKQAQPSSPALIFGSAFHGTVEATIMGKVVEPNPEHRPALAHVWPGVWASKMEAEGDRVEWGADTPEQHCNEGLRLVSDPAVQAMIDGIMPMEDAGGVFIERKVELRVPGVPIPIVGYIDIMTADGVPGDFKTSKSAWSQADAEGEIQPLFYLAALNQAGISVPGNKFRHYVVTKTKKPQAQVLEHSHTWTEVMWLFGLIQQVWRAIEAEVFPTNPNAWLCGPKYCSYWQDCRGKR